MLSSRAPAASAPAKLACLPPALAPRPRLAAGLRRLSPRVRAGGSGSDGAGASDPAPIRRRRTAPASQAYQKLCSALLKLAPLDNAFHRARLSAEVLEAMERTTAGMLGQLPGEFKLRVECEREALQKLLHSAVLTGCMLHNVEARWQLVLGLEAALPDDGGADGAGSALLLLHAQQPPPPPAPTAALAEAAPEVAAYAAALRARLDAAEAALAAASAAASSLKAAPPVPPPAPGTNALLSHLRALQASQVAALSPAGSAELSGACATLVESLLGRLPAQRQPGAHAKGALKPPSLPGLADEDEEGADEARLLADMSVSLSFSREYASELLLWAMGAGHYARAQDHLFRLERSVLGPPAQPRDSDSDAWLPFLGGAAGPPADAP